MADARRREYMSIYNRDREAAHAWAAANPVQRGRPEVTLEHRRARLARYEAAHTDERRTAHRAYYERNRSLVLERASAWKKAHPDIIRAKNRRQAAAKLAVARALKSGPCMDCGGTFPPECMDWDHRPGEVKVTNVARLRRVTAGHLAEIAKCDLVCANCHRVRTRQRVERA